MIFGNIILIFCLQFSCRAFFAVVFLHITSHRSLVNQTVWWVLSLLLLLLQHGKEIIELSCHQIGLDSLEEVDWQTDVYSKVLGSVNRCCMNWSQISSALFVDLSKNVDKVLTQGSIKYSGRINVKKRKNEQSTQTKSDLQQAFSPEHLLLAHSAKCASSFLHTPVCCWTASITLTLHLLLMSWIKWHAANK